MGALVTLDLPADAPALTLPWIITFGPLSDDEEWEPVVCGPYERAHAMALAETVVADEDLMAVVEPLQPRFSADDIRTDIAAARLAADTEDTETVALDAELNGYGADGTGGYDDDGEFHDGDDEQDHEHGAHVEPTPPPSAEEIRAGMARIASKLTTAI